MKETYLFYYTADALPPGEAGSRMRCYTAVSGSGGFAYLLQVVVVAVVVVCVGVVPAVRHAIRSGFRRAETDPYMIHTTRRSYTITAGVLPVCVSPDNMPHPEWAYSQNDRTRHTYSSMYHIQDD